MNLNSILLQVIVLATLVLSTTGISALQILMPTSATLQVTSPSILKGSIANVQLDGGGNPEWIESGFWVMRVRPAASESDLPSINLVSRISMVRVDGTAMHGHTITNFTLTSFSMEGNTTHVFEGKATIAMRDGPISSVPLTIKVHNGAAIAMWIGPDRIDSHFGTSPIYGILTESSRTIIAQMRQGLSTSEPDNGTGVDLESSTVDYYRNTSGYLSQPKIGTNLPAVVMIHEWWGLNQNIKEAADRLATEGYVVLAVDLYNGEVATNSERAGELAGSVRNNAGEAINNLNAAAEYLSTLQNVNSSRLASLGWCFGGGQSLQFALNSDSPLSATVIYYGNLVTNQTELAKITWPVLGIFGSEDQSIPVDNVNQFEASLNASNITNEIYVYEGVGHAFANPSGDNYAPGETADAWEKTLTFLKKYL